MLLICNTAISQVYYTVDCPSIPSSQKHFIDKCFSHQSFVFHMYRKIHSQHNTKIWLEEHLLYINIIIKIYFFTKPAAPIIPKTLPNTVIPKTLPNTVIPKHATQYHHSQTRYLIPPLPNTLPNTTKLSIVLLWILKFVLINKHQYNFNFIVNNLLKISIQLP